MDWRLWLFVSELGILAGLGMTLVAWLVRSELQELRRRRIDRRLRAQFGMQRLALPSAEPPRQPVTVEELVARTEAEGLPTRLRWQGDDGPDDGWPTGVLPIQR